MYMKSNSFPCLSGAKAIKNLPLFQFDFVDDIKSFKRNVDNLNYDQKWTDAEKSLHAKMAIRVRP